MAAIAYPQPQQRRRPGAPLRLVEPNRPRRRRPSRAVYRRRRLLALFVIVGAVLLARAAFGWLGGGPLTASEPVSPPASAQASPGAYVVQPGDTLWTLARRAQPEGDVRDLVNRLASARHGAPLSAGERIVVPLED